MKDRCKDCHFVEPTGKGRRGDVEVDVGVCRRYPPQLTAVAAGAFPPVTLDLDYCGEFVISTEATKAAMRRRPSR